MDSKIVIPIIMAVISAIFAPLTKAIFDKIIADNPTILTTTISKIKSGIVFTLRYILPVANIIYVCITYPEVNKAFVLTICFLFSVINFNIFVDIHFNSINRIREERNKIIDNMVDGMQKVNANILNK